MSKAFNEYAPLKNIPRRNAGAGGQKTRIYYAINEEDIVKFPPIKDDEVTMEGNFIMRKGKIFRQIGIVPKSVKVGAVFEGDPFSEIWKKNVDVDVPGHDSYLRSFIQKHKGKPFVLFIDSCDANNRDIIGCECVGGGGLLLKAKYSDDDKKSITGLTWTLDSVEPIFSYKGVLPVEETFEKIPVDATTIDFSLGGILELQSGTTAAATITNFTNVTHDALYEVRGKGGAFPSKIAQNSVFSLVDGETWTAEENTYILFKAFKNGIDTYELHEVSRGTC